MSKIFDAIHYNGEADILEIRLNILDPIVDEFIIVEAPTTFSGNQKPLYFEQQKERFKKWEHKIKYHVVDENYSEGDYLEAKHSKYTDGQERWIHEYLQKEAIGKFLTHLNDDDIVYIGDVDEIWEHREPKGIEKLKLRVYSYYLNFLSTEEFWGCIRTTYGQIKGKNLNNIRNDISYRTEDYQGWHFTSQGGLDALKQKVVDQYNVELFNGYLLYVGLDERFGKTDFIGRDFKFRVADETLPEWLQIHKEEYKHLFK